MKKILALTMGDLKNIRRDPMLLSFLFIPLILLIVLRFGVPLATGFVQEQFQFDLVPHYVFIVSFIVLVNPLILGMLVGFMILDERDEDILTYFAVTPLSKSGYLLFRIVSPVVVSFGFAFLMVGLSGLMDPAYWRLTPFVLLAALEAPILALFLATFASNKVEGLALGKGSGIIFIAPFIGYLVKAKWQIFAGIFPPYWISKGFVSVYSQGAGYWWYLIGGLVSHGLVLWLFSRGFNQRIN